MYQVLPGTPKIRTEVYNYTEEKINKAQSTSDLNSCSNILCEPFLGFLPFIFFPLFAHLLFPLALQGFKLLALNTPPFYRFVCQVFCFVKVDLSNQDSNSYHKHERNTMKTTKIRKTENIVSKEVSIYSMYIQLLLKIPFFLHSAMEES